MRNTGLFTTHEPFFITHIVFFIAHTPYLISYTFFFITHTAFFIAYAVFFNAHMQFFTAHALYFTSRMRFFTINVLFFEVQTCNNIFRIEFTRSDFFSLSRNFIHNHRDGAVASNVCRCAKTIDSQINGNH